MKIVFTPNGWKDYTDWIEHDRAIVEQINALIDDAVRHPFSGIGKPDPLKGGLRGIWSRRISREHRLLYRIEGKGEDKLLVVVVCRGHYS